jgi:hypothetical protein
MGAEKKWVRGMGFDLSTSLLCVLRDFHSKYRAGIAIQLRSGAIVFL